MEVNSDEEAMGSPVGFSASEETAAQRQLVFQTCPWRGTVCNAEQRAACALLRTGRNLLMRQVRRRPDELRAQAGAQCWRGITCREERGMSTIYGDGFVADRFARVGDTVECDVRHPYPKTLRLVLETPAAAACANDLLMDPKSGWRLVSPRGVRAVDPVEPKLICPACGKDRYKEGCQRNPMGCPMVAKAQDVSGVQASDKGVTEA
jgi:hypothetical protein